MQAQETRDETYNGWKNYPTWAVNLWLENDEGLYSLAVDTVGEQGGPNLRATVADALRELVEGLPIMADNDQGGAEPVDGITGFHADLLGYALDSVDWFEIADAWIEAAAEAS
jgi:hypothetical protein